jgi:phage terminase small subunit
MAVTARSKEWGEYGPAMRALSARQRAFVEFLIIEPPSIGAQTRAARRAGYGTGRTTPTIMAKISSRLIRNEKVLAGINEEARKLLRAGGLEASKALLALVHDSAHKDHARAIGMVLARTDPEIERHDFNVTHTVLDPDTEALEELRALRQLGTAREKLIELFGGNKLPLLEAALEAADKERRAASAKVIDGEAIEVSDHGQRSSVPGERISTQRATYASALHEG